MLQTPNIIQTGENQYHAQFGTDKQLVVEFYKDAELQEYDSEQAGHPIYKEVDMINIFVPGGKNTKKAKVKLENDASGPSDPQRFPTQWAAYKADQEQIPDGTPLKEWAVISKSQALNYKHFKIYTVEQLANVTDQNIGVLGLGGRELREKAKAWLAQAVDASHITKLLARLEALEADNKAYKEKEQLAANEEKPRKIANK